jgi:hypothetical protein
MRYCEFEAIYNESINSKYAYLLTRQKIREVLAHPSNDLLNKSFWWSKIIEAFLVLGVRNLTAKMFTSANHLGWTPESEPLRLAFVALIHEETPLEDYL